MHADCTLRTQRELSVIRLAGSEIFSNYGPKSNEMLLLLHGFAKFNNPNDTYALRWAAYCIACVAVVCCLFD